MGYAITCEIEPGVELDGRTRLHRFRYHLARGFVDPLDRVLDLGCGTGYGTDMLSEITLDVTGYDMEQSNIDYAKKIHSDGPPWFNPINFKVTNIETMDIPKAEVAVSFEVIEHLYKPKEFVARLKEKISKYIVVSVPLGQKLVWVEDKQEWQEEGDSTHHSAFATPDEFMSMFLDDNWKQFYSFRDGVTFIAVFYNIHGLSKH